MKTSKLVELKAHLDRALVLTAALEGDTVATALSRIAAQQARANINSVLVEIRESLSRRLK